MTGSAALIQHVAALMHCALKAAGLASGSQEFDTEGIAARDLALKLVMLSPSRHEFATHRYIFSNEPPCTIKAITHIVNPGLRE
jgi:hypothetical protein